MNLQGPISTAALIGLCALSVFAADQDPAPPAAASAQAQPAATPAKKKPAKGKHRTAHAKAQAGAPAVEEQPAADVAQARSVVAQARPPLDQQKAWTQADKQQFLRYLDSDAPMPSGQVKEVSAPAGQKWVSREARALEVGPEMLMLFPSFGGHYSGTALAMPGVRVMYERHFVPWLRGYAGLEYDSMRQQARDRAWESLDRYAVPVGLEFALVPLSTPQTRYVIMRLGASISNISGSATRADFAAPLLGTSAAWDLGLGYEWQISDSNWRVNGTFDGLRSISNRSGVGYYGFGANLGIVYTF